jgi:antitoxin component HigA of HigAB toxin-antitoxin module
MNSATPKSKSKMTVKKILDRVKSARTQVESLLKDRSWIDQAKRVATKQGQEAKRILDSDIVKLKTFLEKERKELEKLQGQIPGEVQKIKKFMDQQKQELAKLLGTVKTVAEKKASKAKASAKTKATAAARTVSKKVTKTLTKSATGKSGSKAKTASKKGSSSSSAGTSA